MTAPNKYIVIVNFLGTLTRGDVVTAKQLPADVKELLAEKSIRPATAEEAGSKETWVHEGVAPERLIIVPPADEESEESDAPETAPAAPKKAATKSTKKPTAPTPAPAPVAPPVVESVDVPETPPGD